MKYTVMDRFPVLFTTLIFVPSTLPLPLSLLCLVGWSDTARELESMSYPLCWEDGLLSVVSYYRLTNHSTLIGTEES